MSHARQPKRWQPLVLAALLALAGSGCAGPGDDGVGGTGVTASTDGIGGTGVQDPDDGIGGTGAQAASEPDGIGGTGIVGVVSALGSVIVNGLHVDLPARVEVTRNGRPGAIAAVARGQLVAIVAYGPEERLQARELQILDALLGPVQQVDPASGRLEMMGQTLRIDPASVVMDASIGDLHGVAAGERLRVSGLWRADGVLEVTRIERAQASEPDVVFGPVTALVDGGLRIGRLRVLGSGVHAVEAGQHVRATGVADDGTLRAGRFAAQPLAGFQDRIGRLVVEAYPSVDGTLGVSLGPLRAQLPTSDRVSAPLRDAAVKGQRVVVDARMVAGRVEIGVVRPTDRPAPSSRPAPVPVDTPRLETDAMPRPEPPESIERPDTFERPVPVERPVLPQRIERAPRPTPIERPPRLDRPTDIRPVDARPASARPLKARR